MTVRERVLKVFNFESPNDRLPMVEWAYWWDKTVSRWHEDGLPSHLGGEELLDYFGIDRLQCIGAWPISWGTLPLEYHATHHGAGILKGDDLNATYDIIRPHLFVDSAIESLVNSAKRLKEQHDKGEVALRIWIEGFFWFPRILFGIEEHLYAFFDYPELMHRINSDLAEFNIKAIKALLEVLTPEFIGIAEDMSYNNGPMLSKDMYDEFVAPYYAKLTPVIKDSGVKVLVDTDGDVTEMIPWLIESGMDGIYPLERQAGVDIAVFREKYPRLLMLGGYDKMVMSHGEAAMRAEFERLLPVMRSGGFIPSVDHQTPPGVSLENYQIYSKLLAEYCAKACKK